MPADPFIRTSVLTLEQLFSGEYRFRLPWLQRAYAWNELHVGRLIDDVHVASSSDKRRYSLGHVFLAKPGSAPDSSLIDGHQRAMTLTILFALLRDLLPAGPAADHLHALIEGREGAGYHLSPQPSIAAFYARFVQERTRSLADPDGDLMDLTQSERDILANRHHMRRKIEKLMPAPEQLAAFAEFVRQRCHVLVEIVEDEDEAWSLLSIEEETGLGLHSAELSKMSLVMEMPRAEQEAAGRFYEQAQAVIGADEMAQLLCHIRTLKVRKRSSRPVVSDLKARFKLNRSGLSFLERELLPRAETMVLLNRRAIGSGEAREATAQWIDTLFWLDHQFWMPPALHWLAVRGGDDTETPLFFARLDRLSYLLKIASVDPTDQERRLLDVLDDIDHRGAVDFMPQLAIEAELRSDALENLRSQTFYSKRFHGLVLRRVSWNLASDRERTKGRDPGAVDGRHVTVEHVLPRKPPQDRRWWQDFKNEALITAYCNRIGNLAFLSNEDNRRADTLDYVLKRPILQGTAGRFVLAEHAAGEETWTGQVIMARSQALIEALFAPWELPT